MVPHRSPGRPARIKTVAIVATLAVVAGSLPAAPAQASGAWARPVRGPVVRPYREPLARFASGHRGVDFAAPPGTPVRAANDGRVTFAGSVAGSLHVVVAHDGGIRTTSSFLARVDVHSGQTVARGQVIGISGGQGEGHTTGVLHLGARIGDRYFDPMLLFGPTDLTLLVRLVPVDERDAAGRASPTDEARQIQREQHDDGSDGGGDCFFGIWVAEQVCDVVSYTADKTKKFFDAGFDLLIGVGGEALKLAEKVAKVGRDVIGMARDVANGVIGAAERFGELLASGAVAIFNAVVEAGRKLIEQLTSCPQPPPIQDPKGSGNLVMAVAGLDSSVRRLPGGTLASSFHVAVHTLGYHDDDVARFSYDPTSPTYGHEATHGDLHAQARSLGRQIQAFVAEHPGRSVDLVAHSQGGVVIDLFLKEVYEGHESEYPPIENIVTFASPHEGTPLANLETSADTSLQLEPLLGVVRQVKPDVPLGAQSIKQLQEGSPTIRTLLDGDAKLPEGVRYLSIVGAEDPFVPSSSADVPGGHKIVVPVGGVLVPDDHTAILYDADALSAAQAHISGGHPVDSCGPAVDLGGELYSTVVRLTNTVIKSSGPTVGP